MSHLSFTETRDTRHTLDAEACQYPALRELLTDIRCMEGAAVALCEGTLAVRLTVDEGDYAFFPPMPYREGADTDAALRALEAYAVREQLPLVLTDLSEEDCRALTPRYTHARIYELPEAGRFLLYVETEAERLEALPTLDGERVTLTAPRLADAAAYGALCRNAAHLRFFGYSDLAEHPDATDRSLVEARLAEWERRTALPFFIYNGDVFIGELVLFGFDGRGTAELSIRLLPEATGRGLATDAVRTALTFAENGLRLRCVRGRCHRDNIPCRRMLTRLMGDGVTEGELICFSHPPAARSL